LNTNKLKHVPKNIAKFKNQNKMENLNAIGLNSGQSKQLAERLNELLSNYSIFFQNCRHTGNLPFSHPRV